MTTRIRWTLLPLTVAFALAACGGGGGDDDTDAIASLGDETTTTAGSDGGGGGGGDRGSAEFEEAMLEYAECMRDEGVDFPDPQISDEGGMVVMGPAPASGGERASERDMQEFEAADEVCREILDDAAADMPRPSPEEQEEMREQALAFSECMREHGIEDYPDPEFNENGGITMRMEEENGIDPEDPDFQEAQEACAEENGMDMRVGAAEAPGAARGARGDD